MAEIVGLIASIATLAEVAGKTGGTISRIRKLHASPPRYIETAQNEIKGFTAALDIIQDILKSQNTPPPDKVELETARLHAQATVVLQEFDDFLQRKVLRSGSNGGSVSLRRRAIVKEVFGEAQAEFSDFQQQLVSIKLNLQLVLQALQVYYFQPSSWHLQRVSVIRAGVTTTVEASHRDVTTAFVEKAVTTSATTKDDCILFEMQQPGRRCRSKCPCQCHIGLRGSTPRWLRGLIGTVFYDLSGVPIINRQACNFKLCGGATNGSARVQYVLPTWVLPCAIEATASWHTLIGSGGTWSLRVPRYINDDDVYNKFSWLVRYGTVAGFQELMSTSGMRAFDVFDSSFDVCSTLFALAVWLGRPDICHMLLEAGADVSYRDPCGVSLAELFWSAYHLGCSTASLSKHPKLVETYDTLSVLPGHDLLINDRLDALVAFLDTSPMSVSLKDDHGFTLLHWASRRADLDAVQALIAAGADVNVQCKRGQTPMMLVGDSDVSFEIYQMMLRAGADVNLTDLKSMNALMLALDNKYDTCRIVELLLNVGTNLHQISDADRDALEYLTEKSQTPNTARVCTLLLDHGLTPVRQKDYGWNAVALSISENNYDMLKTLIQRGAALNTIAPGDSSTNISKAAAWADIRTMGLLRDARIRGLPMDSRTVQEYWDDFDERDKTFIGVRDFIEDEEAAFQELLDSIIPMGPEPIPTSVPEKNLVPGAFPEDEDDSIYADSASDSDDVESHSTQDSEDFSDAPDASSDKEDNTLVDGAATQLPFCQHPGQVTESISTRKDSIVC